MKQDLQRRNITKGLSTSEYRVSELESGESALNTYRDEVEHGKARQQLLPAYMGKDIMYNVEATIGLEINNLISLLETKYVSQGSDVKTCNIGEKIEFFNL